jgi:flagellar biosynthesis/type III secretory pathway chaperone
MSKSPPRAGVLTDQDSSLQPECITTAIELLKVLREETRILKRFAGAELLRLVPRKEYLVNELGWRLKSAKEAGGGVFSASDSFKALLREIDKVNNFNGVFIKKTLGYWRELLAVLLPLGYGKAGKQEKPARSPRGLTFEREV